LEEEMNILLAEDEQKIANLIIELLKKDGYQVDYAKDGEEAIHFYKSNSYNILILD
jgi:DNA-binding response OmpR family regulator